jgi:tRNA pseudouridine55 synthase
MLAALCAFAYPATVRTLAPVRHRVEIPLGRVRACSSRVRSAVTLNEDAVALPSSDVNGLLVAYKPSGWSSFLVVDRIKKTLNRERKLPNAPGNPRTRKHKVGHGGTLDPLATGLLVIGVGRGCRELEGYLKGSKAYRAQLTFGTETDTQDSTGVVIRTADASGISLEGIRAALPAFTGQIMQRPPAFSAISINGTRSYARARAGTLTESDMEPRPVVVHELRADALEEQDASDGTRALVADLYVECGGGTYIRALIVDLARALGTAAHMSALERIKQGPFELGHPGVRILTEEHFRDADAIIDAMESAERHMQAMPPQPDGSPVDDIAADYALDGLSESHE